MFCVLSKWLNYLLHGAYKNNFLANDKENINQGGGVDKMP